MAVIVHEVGAVQFARDPYVERLAVYAKFRLVDACSPPVGVVGNVSYAVARELSVVHVCGLLQASV